MSALREVDGALVEHWYIAALSRELAPGAVIGRTVYDNHYALFRDERGRACAVEDRCLHRGAKLSEGHCEKGRVMCPYHGWTFDSTGLVVDIPSEGPGCEAQVRARDWRIDARPVVEQDGAIWLWAGSGAPDPATPPWRFPHAGEFAWTQYFMITDFPNEVTHLVQNFMDVPHTVYVHSKWFRDRKLMEVPYELETGAGRVKATYHKPKDTIGSIMSRVINPERREMQHTDEFIFPNLTRVDYRFGAHGFIINSQCTPVSRYKTRVYTWIAYRGSWYAPLFKPVMRFYTRRVITQDVDIMANQGENLQRFSDRAWKSTAADEIHIAITKLREKGVTDPRAAIAKAVTRKDRTFWI